MGDDAAVEAFVTKATKDGWNLCQMRCTVLDNEQLKTLFSWSSKEKKSLISQCKAKELVGVEVCGAACYSQVEEAFAATGLAIAAKNIRIVPRDQTAVLAKAFFETWKDAV